MNRNHKFTYAPILPIDKIKPSRKTTLGEILCIPVMVLIAYIGGKLMGWTP